MRVPAWRRAVAATWPTPRSFPVIVLIATAILLAGLYITYRLVDPLPPRHFVIAAGIAESGYDNFAKRYARILARDGVDLEIRNTAGAVENLDLLRDPASKVQAALITLGFAHPGDADHLASLGGVFDAPIFVFYKSAERLAQFAQLRGKRLAIGTAGTSVRPLILQVLEAGGAADAPTRFVDLDYDRAVDALIAGEIDVAIFPSQLDTGLFRRALAAPDVRLMNVAQAEAIAKTVPGIKHLVSLATFRTRTSTCSLPAIACWCERTCTRLCNICYWKRSAKFTRRRGRSIGSVSFPPSNPAICRSLSPRKASTAQAQRSGNDTRRSG